MIYEVGQPISPLVDELPKLSYNESKITPNQVRLIQHEGSYLIFFDDYEKIVNESGMLRKVLHSHNLSPDQIGGLVIDEIRIIRNPRLCKIAKNCIPAGKLFIRKMNLSHTRKLAEDALDYFFRSGDSSRFDAFVEGAVGQIGQAAGRGIVDGAKDAFNQQLNDLKQKGKKYALYGGIGLAGLGVASAIGSHYAKKYADDDARKHPEYRSELIKKLRTLSGLLPEYEGKYARADRLSYEQKGIIGKIIHKIKNAIRAIKFKLKNLVGHDPYYYSKT